MKVNTWRQRFAPVIRSVIAEHAGATPAEVRKALREAWDDMGMGERACFPYKAWLAEIRAQMDKGKDEPTPRQSYPIDAQPCRHWTDVDWAAFEEAEREAKRRRDE